MTKDKTDPMNEFIATITPPDAWERLKRLRALGPVRIPERFLSPPKNLTEEQRWSLHEHIETVIRQDRIRRLIAM